MMGCQSCCDRHHTGFVCIHNLPLSPFIIDASYSQYSQTCLKVCTDGVLWCVQRMLQLPISQSVPYTCHSQVWMPEWMLHTLICPTKASICIFSAALIRGSKREGVVCRHCRVFKRIDGWILWHGTSIAKCQFYLAIWLKFTSDTHRLVSSSPGNLCSSSDSIKTVTFSLHSNEYS